MSQFPGFGGFETLIGTIRPMRKDGRSMDDRAKRPLDSDARSKLESLCIPDAASNLHRFRKRAVNLGWDTETTHSLFVDVVDSSAKRSRGTNFTPSSLRVNKQIWRSILTMFERISIRLPKKSR